MMETSLDDALKRSSARENSIADRHFHGENCKTVTQMMDHTHGP